MGKYLNTIIYTPPHRKRCEKCYYHDNLTRTCDYILIEGHSRGCDAAECTKWKPRIAGKRKGGGK